MIARWLALLVHPRWRDEILQDLEDEHRERIEVGVGRTWSVLHLAVAVLVAAVASRWHGRGSGADRGTSVQGSGIEAWGRGTGPGRGSPGGARGRSHGDGRGGMGASWKMFDELVQDVRFAVRGLRRSPLFTLVALVTLGSGIGLTVSIFAVVHGVLLRPLDYLEPERLVLLQGEAGARRAVPMPLHLRFRDGIQGLQDAVAWQGWAPVADAVDDAPIRLSGASVGWDFFALVGVTPVAGSVFDDGHAAPGHEPAVVLGHDLWTRRFGGDPSAVGDLVRLDGEDHRIVGVAPAGFVDPVSRGLGWSSPEVWRAEPPSFREAELDDGWVGFWTLGRLRQGVHVDQVTRAMRDLVRGMYPDRDVEQYAASFRAVTVQEAVVEEVRPTLLVLFLGVVVVLLIACVNLANLLLSRGTVRRDEFGVRTSLGAGRGRLVRQLLTESTVLALLGAALGIVLALAGVRVLVRLAGPGLPRATDVGVDGVVLLFTVLAAVGTALLFGTVPALRASAAGAVRAAGGRALGRSRSDAGLRKVLVVLETAMAMVLLTGAGLLAGTFLRLQSLDPGFDPEPVLTVQVGLQPERFPEPELQNEALRGAEEALAALPGVLSVGSITDLPLSGAVNSTRVRRPGEPDEVAAERPHVLVRAVTPGYFDAVGVRRVRGRSLDRAARVGGEEVAVVNETFMRLFGPDDLLGQVVAVRGVERRIIAVVADVQEFEITGRGADPVLYTPYEQEREGWMRSGTNLVVRSSGDPSELVPVVPSAVTAAQPGILVGSVRPLDGLVEAQLRRPRLRAVLVGVFAGLAVILAAVGLGGVVAYNVARRVPEIGLRLALGAAPAQVLALMLREIAVLSAAGVVVGLAASLAAGRVLAGFLFQVEPSDPLVLGAAAALLLAVGLVAGWIPAHGATRVEPSRALRGE